MIIKYSIHRYIFLLAIVSTLCFVEISSAIAKPTTAETKDTFIQQSIILNLSPWKVGIATVANHIDINIQFSEAPNPIPKKGDFKIGGKTLEQRYAGKLRRQGITIGTIGNDPKHYKIRIGGKTGEVISALPLHTNLIYRDRYQVTLVKGGTKSFIDLIKKYMNSVRTSFQSVWEKGDVVINWTTEAELNNAGFNILRSETPKGPFEPINAKLIPSAGSADTQHTYKWIDTTAKRGTDYYYQIEDLSFSGKRNQLATIKLEALISPKNKLTTQWGAVKRRY